MQFHNPFYNVSHVLTRKSDNYTWDLGSYKCNMYSSMPYINVRNVSSIPNFRALLLQSIYISNQFELANTK
jgi:hypothetical protein